MIAAADPQPRTSAIRDELRDRIQSKRQAHSNRSSYWRKVLDRSGSHLQADGLNLKWSRFIPHNPFLKQAAVLSLDQYREILFGGAAGGGKSELLLMAALQYADVPGYSAIIFRRTLTAASRSGGVLDRAHNWLAGTDAVWDSRTNAYLFPTSGAPAVLAFGYVDTFDDFQNYQGPEYQFCVAKGTPIKIGNGRTTSIENLSIGDYVETLEGLKRVTKTFKPRVKQCVSVGGQVQGIDHRILTPYGWFSYDRILELSKQFHAACKYDGASRELFLVRQSLVSCLPSDSSPVVEHALQAASDIHRQSGSHAFLEDDRNDGEVFHDSRLTTSPLPTLFFPVVRLLPVSSSRESLATRLPQDVTEDVQRLSLRRGFQGDYPADSYSYDVRLHRYGDSGLVRLPLLADAATKSRLRLPPDALDNAPSRTHARLSEYVHPYTRERRPVDAAVEVVPLEFVPCGEREVYDIRVESVSNYISSSNIVSTNCGWDELTQFPDGWGKESYLYMFSRLRRLTGSDVPLRVRAACNPGGWGHQWVKERFDIRKCLSTETFKGYSTKRPFVPSYAWDNPYLDTETYLENLLELDPVTREQLLSGDWSVTTEGRFKPQWFRRYCTRDPYLSLSPSIETAKKNYLIDQCRMFLTCDYAGTEAPTESFRKNQEPSWSVISTWLAVNNRYLLLWNSERFQVETPELITRIKAVYDSYKQRSVRPEFIAGEANGFNFPIYQSLCNLGLPMKPIMPHTDKLARSTGARLRAERGDIYLPAPGDRQHGPWLESWEDEIFRWTGHPWQTADQVDALSNADLCMSTEISNGASETNGNGSAIPIAVPGISGIGFGTTRR